MVSLFAVLNLTKGRIRSIYFLPLIPIASLFSGAYVLYRNASYFETATLSRVFDEIQGVGVLNLLLQGFGLLSSYFETFLLVLRDFPSSGAEYLYGDSFLSLPWLIIPTSVFPSKPIYTDAFLTKLFSSTNNGPSTGLAFGALSEWYINFGWIGIVAGAFIIGTILRMMYSYVVNNRDNPSVVLWFTQTAFILPQSLAIGGLYSVASIEIIFFSILTFCLTHFLAPSSNQINVSL
jgi:hypothetical protein